MHDDACREFLESEHDPQMIEALRKDDRTHAVDLCRTAHPQPVHKYWHSDLNTEGSPDLPLGYEFFKPDKSDWSKNKPIKVSFNAINIYDENLNPSSLFDNVIQNLEKSNRKEIILYPHSFEEYADGGLSYEVKVKGLITLLPIHMQSDVNYHISRAPTAHYYLDDQNFTGNIFINDNLDNEIFIISFDNSSDNDVNKFSMNLIYIFNNNNEQGIRKYNDFFTLNLDNINHTTIDINTIYNEISDDTGRSKIPNTTDNMSYLRSIHLPRFDNVHNDDHPENMNIFSQGRGTDASNSESLDIKQAGILDDYEGHGFIMFTASTDMWTKTNFPDGEPGLWDNGIITPLLNDGGMPGSPSAANMTPVDYPGIAGYNRQKFNDVWDIDYTIKDTTRTPVINYKIRPNPKFEDFLHYKKFIGLENAAEGHHYLAEVGANRLLGIPRMEGTNERTTTDKQDLRNLNISTHDKIKQLQTAIGLKIEAYNMEIIEEKASKASLMLLARLLGTSNDIMDYGDITTGCTNYRCEDYNLRVHDNWRKNPNPESDIFYQCNNEDKDSIASLMSPGSHCSKEICCKNMICETGRADCDNRVGNFDSIKLNYKKCDESNCDQPTHCCTPQIEPEILNFWEILKTFKENQNQNNDNDNDNDCNDDAISNIDIRNFIYFNLLDIESMNMKINDINNLDYTDMTVLNQIILKDDIIIPISVDKLKVLNTLQIIHSAQHVSIPVDTDQLTSNDIKSLIILLDQKDSNNLSPLDYFLRRAPGIEPKCLSKFEFQFILKN